MVNVGFGSSHEQTKIFPNWYPPNRGGGTKYAPGKGIG